MINWRKSSYSHGTDNSDCVELASIGDMIGIRDSKAPGGHLSVPKSELAMLVGLIKVGDFSL
ncbi:DUF397 domain-containing protein [Actinomadura hibisca]|uniref:DUF397 domain-containing protein n=1 Tax=Actinomadura hibisca TaxID=68565 RepID=UPI00082E8E91|nr:DUF397 domain-containing protein [Actinomadura hibisca]